MAQAGVFLVWYLVVEKMWYRTEAFYANRWGTDYTFTRSGMKPRRNPNFNGSSKPWNIDLNMTRLAPDPWKQRRGRLMSVLVMTFFIALSFVLVLLIRSHAEWITIHTTTKVSVPSLLLAFQIHTFEEIWNYYLAPRLMRWEIHTYMHTMEASISEKFAIFTFFNKFQSFSWLAYVGPFVFGKFPECPTSGLTGLVCVREILQVSLRTTYKTLVIVFLITATFPRCFILYKYYKQKGDLKKLGLDSYTIGSMEEQTKMKEYEGRRASKDYLRVISAMAFVALFGATAPTIVVFAYVAVTFQHRIDAIQVCVNYQRPFPDHAADIGFWNSVLAALRIMVIVNTSALISSNPNVNFFLERVAQTGGNATNFGSTDGAVREVAFFHLLFAALLTMYLVDALVGKDRPRTILEKHRQSHQRQTFFSGQAQKNVEKVEIRGQANWNDEGSCYHKKGQLRPGDPWYHPGRSLV